MEFLIALILLLISNDDHVSFSSSDDDAKNNEDNEDHKNNEDHEKIPLQE